MDIKQGLRNLSIRKSIVLYIITFMAIATLLSVATTHKCRNAREQIDAAYPQTGERYYLTNEAGEQLGEGALISDDIISYSAQDERTLHLINLVENLSVPFTFSSCMLFAVLAFYHNKLKKPLAVLDKASERIGNNDLDFRVDYANKDEMGKLCASFEKMRFSLQQSNQLMWRQMEQRKRLNAAFAHDLRTPLTVLKGYSEILQFEGDKTSVKETTITMSRHIERLERYVDSMSNLQRMEDITPEYREIDLDAYLPQAAQMAELICEKSGKVCVFQPKIARKTVWLDIEMLSQVMENLVTNAARYACGRVGIEIAEMGDTINISVSDDGVGFTAESLDKAAEPYYTLETDKANHFGLGLYICKLLCKNHGGDLNIGNTERGGLVTAVFKIADAQ